MHIAEALLSPEVAIPMCIVSGGVLALSAVKVNRNDAAEKKLPFMAVGAAFVFAAQMINFAIPGTGASGHITGGTLLAALLGGECAVMSLAAVLVIQALFFADGGIFALGCNIFNMGILPCIAIYPLFFKPLTKKFGGKAIFAASVVSSVLALQAGSFAAVTEITLSGAAVIPFKPFLLLMQPIHFAIGLAEGVITGAVLKFVYASRPDILDCAEYEGNFDKSSQRFALIFGTAAVLAALALSVFASTDPDGLEWSLQKIGALGSL